MANGERKRGKKSMPAVGIVLLLCLLIAGSVYIIFFRGREHFYYGKSEEAFYNPMQGFAPNADYVEAVGDNSLVYVDITWRELEPSEGEYDFAAIKEENFLDKWRAEGKKAVFRFVCDVPSQEAHMDIPDWLYEKTGDGVFYDGAYGKGYSPDYNNDVFIEYHKKAIAALGKEYGQDSFFCFVELGSVGHWGEWHVKYDEGIKRIPEEEICRQYILPYIDAFPKAKLLMRRPFQSVSEFGMGVYNDMTGEPEATREWLSWIGEGTVYDEAAEPLTLPACPQIWEKAPVGGEFTSSLSMEEMLVDKWEQTAELLRESHMTFIGPKCPIANREQVEFAKETEEVRKLIGYRYGVSEAKLSYDFFGEGAKLHIYMQNNGTAPMYFDWPVCVYVYDENGAVVERMETDIALSKLAEGEGQWGKVTIAKAYSAEKEKRKIAVGIENPDTGVPEVHLDMAVEEEDLRYRLW